MQETSSPGLRLMIVDDDALSREVVALLAADAGFSVEAYESGDAALDALGGGEDCRPDVILADMQMPGLCGAPLARLFRSFCGQRTFLIAISGTPVPWEAHRDFHTFVLKPFSMQDIRAALELFQKEQPAPMTASRPISTQPEIVLNMATYCSLAEGMPRDQLQRLYTMCLDDADARIETLRQASLHRDVQAWKHAAHSIKGGCGMVGAAELARLAAEMEQSGLPPVDNVAPFEEFLAASGRLRRILDAQN